MAIIWDEDWDKFEDQGFSSLIFAVSLPFH